MIDNTQTENQKSAGLSWIRVFLVGITVYFLSLVIMIFTGNSNLFPTVVMIGNFLVPITFVSFFYGHRHLSKLTLPTTALTFFYGGLLGVLASSILEPIFIQQLTPITFLTVGVIEESAKILGVLVIARRMRHNSEMDGLIMGAAAGMGFAALESMGYVFTAFVMSGGSLTATVMVTLVRGILSPLGHGVWTAILASVLFRESGQEHFRINWKVILAFLTVVVLHALWDGFPGVVAAVLSPGVDVFIAQSLVGGLGLLLLWIRWRDARRLQIEQLIAEEAAQVVETLPLPIDEPFDEPAIEPVNDPFDEPVEIKN